MSTLAAGGDDAQEVAVVGGGIAGLTCAHFLAKQGLEVTLFDMGRSHPGKRGRSIALPRSIAWA